MKRKRIAITASTGMLGSMLYKELKNFYDLILIYRNEDTLTTLFETYGKTQRVKLIHFDFIELYKTYISEFSQYSRSELFEKLITQIGEVDTVINCIGIIKPYIKHNELLAFFINGALPNILSGYYKEKFIHITTDCVFSGHDKSPYTELHVPTPTDLYGLSKSLGEPACNSLVLRTSIIGPEIHGFVSLLSWMQRQKGEIQGYTTHLWNGITTKQYAAICRKIIEKRSKFPTNGLFHIFSEDITKYDLLCLLQKKYNLPISIIPAEPSSIDRRLRTIYTLNQQLEIPSQKYMISLL